MPLSREKLASIKDEFYELPVAVARFLEIAGCVWERRQKNFRGEVGGQRKKDRKITLFSLYLLYLYHV